MNIDDLAHLWNDEIKAFPQEFKGVMLGASGHLDSTALFHLFCEINKGKKKFLEGVIHLNYGLRGSDSEDDQKRICDLAKQHGVNVFTYKPTSEELKLKGHASIQDWARTVRFNRFQEFMDQGYIVALAHHLDDLAENALFRMIRGAEVTHTLGMKRFHNGIWRPLLHLTRDEIETYAMQNGLKYGVDSTNASVKYSRNRIRHNVISELKVISDQASQKLVSWTRDAEELGEFVKAGFRKHFGASPKRIPISETQNLKFSIFKQLLGVVFESYDVGFYQWNEDHIKKAFEKLRAGGSFRFGMSDDWLLISDGDTWWLESHDCTESDPLYRAKHSFAGAWQLPPDSSVYLEGPGHRNWKISNLGQENQLEVCIRTAKLKERVTASDCTKEWQIKELYSRNRQTLYNGAILYIIGVNDGPTVLFDGHSLLRPDRNGKLLKFNVSDFSINAFVNVQPS